MKILIKPSSRAWEKMAGLAFGFLLQKGQILRYDQQLGALRLSDMTINHWFLIVPLVVGGIVLFRWFERKG